MRQVVLYDAWSVFRLDKILDVIIDVEFGRRGVSFFLFEKYQNQMMPKGIIIGSSRIANTAKIANFSRGMNRSTQVCRLSACAAHASAGLLLTKS